MLLIKNNKFTLTLITYVILALTLVEATSHSTSGVSRRDHGNLKRFIKKRSPFPQPPQDPKQDPSKGQNFGSGDSILDIPPPPVIGAEGAPSDTTTGVSASTSGSTSTSASQSVSTSASVSVSASTSASQSTSSSTSTSQSTSTTSKTEAAPTLPTETSTPTKSTVTLLSTASAPTETPNNSKIAGAATTQSKTVVMTVLIVVAASVGGIAILWTIFRKWKLGRSKEFDQRLQPIDWQPTSHDDDGIIPAHRRHSGASSIRRNYGAASDASPTEYRSGSLQPLPDHDFTAGASLAPVGGYADLSRGPSPQPQMMERGPSPAMGRSGYDAGLPLHHQGYGSQDAFNGARY